MLFDASAFARLGIEGSVDATSASASFATSTGDILEVTAYAGGAFRLRVGPRARPDYGLLVGRPRAFSTAQRDVATWSLANDDAELTLGGSPCVLRLAWKGQTLLESTTDRLPGGGTRLPAVGRAPRGGLWSAAFALASGAPVYGLGEKFGALDKRGELVHSQVEDAQSVNTGQSYRNVPFAWSPVAGQQGVWGVFVHTPGMVTHGVGHPDWSHRNYAVVVDDEALDLVLFAADTPGELLAAFTALVGRAPPLPRWSLGLWAAGAHDTTQAALDTARRLRERRVPCDVVVVQAAALAPTPSGDDTDAAARNPAAALAQLRALGLRTCVREHPYIPAHSHGFNELAQRGFLLRNAHGAPYAAAWRSGERDAATEVGLFDFTHADAYAWWRDAHETLFANGAAAIDNTGGEHVPDDAVAHNGDWGRRLHNAYPLLLDRCVFEATAKFSAPDDAPPLVWSRSGWTGSMRHAVGSTGAAQSDWEGLAATLRGALSWGLSGGALAGIDVGGDYGDGIAGELYARWLQVAVFASHLRLPRAPDREPWAFGAEIEAICRKWLAFRYRLVPYLEASAAAASATGLPLMRAMPLVFPQYPLLRAYETQFMCGEALLVAPIVRPGGEVEVALPPGAWFDLNTRQRLPGRQVLRYRAKPDQFPVFGREGYLLPLGRTVQHTGEIDAAAPLERAWIFGKPAAPLTGYAQVAARAAADGTHAIHAAANVQIEVFGDAAGVDVQPL
ncbi:MAG: glycoside hydrolase family 31 protein [Burkholderiales bacterium]|nr:glycoside hydrolase family 31 protein [Burkholderiales bacterium]